MRPTRTALTSDTHLFAIGMLALVSQVVVLRELNVAFYGVELVYLLGVGGWLVWHALGTLASGRRGRPPSTARLRLLFVTLALALPLDVVFVRGLRRLMGGVPGAYLPIGDQLIGLALALLPPAALLGMLFTGAATRAATRGDTLARAYAVESAGGLAGGILVTGLAMAGMANLPLALIGALLALAAAVGGPPRHRGAVLGVLLIAVLLLAALRFNAAIDAALTRWNHPHLLATADTPYSRVTLTGRAGQIAVFQNDALVFDSQDPAIEVLAHLAALQHPAPERILICGGGSPGLVRELLQHRPGRIDVVARDRRKAALVGAHLPAAPDTAPVHTHIADPRRFVRQSTRWDLIVNAAAPPDTGQANRFYTVAFFRRCRAGLRPGGVLALRLPSAENLWTPALEARNAGVVRAVTTVFPHVVVVPGTSDIILAAMHPLPRRPDPLIERFTRRGLRTRLLIPPYIRYLYTNDRFSAATLRLATAPTEANRDNHPVCYRFSLAVWLSAFWPSLGQLRVSPAMWRYLAAGMLAAAVLAWAATRRDSRRRMLLIAAAGFTGMVDAGVLLLFHQFKHGALFQNVGLLLGLFMAGLSLGAGGWHHLAARVPGPVVRAWGRALPLALAGLNLLILVLLTAGSRPGLAAIGSLTAGAAALTAAVFAHLSLSGRPDQPRVVAPLYAADLLGGSLGAVAGGLVLIPFGGLPATAAVLVLLALAIWALQP